MRWMEKLSTIESVDGRSPFYKDVHTILRFTKHTTRTEYTRAHWDIYSRQWQAVRERDWEHFPIAINIPGDKTAYTDNDQKTSDYDNVVSLESSRTIWTETSKWNQTIVCMFVQSNAIATKGRVLCAVPRYKTINVQINNDNLVDWGSAEATRVLLVGFFSAACGLWWSTSKTCVPNFGDIFPQKNNLRANIYNDDEQLIETGLFCELFH